MRLYKSVNDTTERLRLTPFLLLTNRKDCVIMGLAAVCAHLGHPAEFSILWFNGWGILYMESKTEKNIKSGSIDWPTAIHYAEKQIKSAKQIITELEETIRLFQEQMREDE